MKKKGKRSKLHPRINSCLAILWKRSLNLHGRIIPSQERAGPFTTQFRWSISTAISFTPNMREPHNPITRHQSLNVFNHSGIFMKIQGFSRCYELQSMESLSHHTFPNPFFHATTRPTCNSTILITSYLSCMLCALCKLIIYNYNFY